MTYRKRTHMSAKMAAARAAKARLRMERPAPDYPPELPMLRRTVIVIDHDFGEVQHRLDLRAAMTVSLQIVWLGGKVL